MVRTKRRPTCRLLPREVDADRQCPDGSLAGVVASHQQSSSDLEPEQRAVSPELKVDSAERRVRTLEAIIETQAERLRDVEVLLKSGAIREARMSADNRRNEARLIGVRAEMEGVRNELRMMTDREKGCVGCFDAPATVALIPCGHLLYCERCALKSRDQVGDRCTLCDKPAKQFRIYPI
ncbi:g701 [Coccomyxa elongata]